jgi:hypothetical protein
MKEPRLRTVEKYQPPFPLNKFPANFRYKLGEDLVYHLATRSSRLEGQDWEEIFAHTVGAEWKPSNVGLDDVTLGQCAWGAKTVKHADPANAKVVRLISGRNSPKFSYEVSDVTKVPPNELGAMVLEIWNERVSGVKQKFKHLRTVVLIKSDDLLRVSVFEFETVRFEPEKYSWAWNKNKNLIGIDPLGQKKFTWQPHGSQFTINENVPCERLAIRIRKPGSLDRKEVLKALKYDTSWIEDL